MLTQSEIASELYRIFRELVPYIPESVQQVYQTAIDYYGEENVELQRGFCYEAIYDYLNNNTIGDVLNGFYLESAGIYNNHSSESGALALREGQVLHSLVGQLTHDKIMEQKHLPVFQILVRFQDFQVTNENDVSTDIEEMFVMVPIDCSGRAQNRMKWCRTKTSVLHYTSQYRHSHLPTSSEENYGRWQNPCLGTGPICLTFNTLQDELNLDLWPLLWHEIDMCIRVESLAGGPYYKITDISHRNLVKRTYEDKTMKYLPYHKSILPFKDIVLSELIKSGKLRWKWNIDHLEIANTFTEFTLLLSNQYINALLSYQLIDEPTPENAAEIIKEEIQNGRMYYGRFTNNDKIQELHLQRFRNAYEDVPLGWLFKGEPVCLKVVDDSIKIEKYALLHPLYVSVFYSNLTLLANSIYGSNNKRK